MRRPPLRVFWWSPARSPRLAFSERRNASAWLRLGVATRRPLLNFGDELSALVVGAVAGRRVRWSRPAQAELLAIGSILNLAITRGVRGRVWGSGLRAPLDAAGAVAARELDYVAVRGPWTRDILNLPSATPLGDPGLLAPLLVRRRERAGAHPILIPHFTAWGTTEARRAVERASGSLQVVEPSLPPLVVLRHIAAAPAVFSSSLHGVIVAHSLGVPAVLVEQHDAAGGEPEWKYADYYRSMEIAPVRLSLVELGDHERRAGAVHAAHELSSVARSRAESLGARLVGALEHAYT